jgi:hypothetical protein
MSDKATELTQEEKLKQSKIAHDYFATAIQTLTTRVQYYHEEFEAANGTIFFLRNMRDQILKDIERIEPPKAKEPAKPYVMDIPDAPAELSQ